MGIWPSDYTEKVLDDVKKYDGIRKIVKAGLIERYTVKHCSPQKLHPNPEDEFSMESVGPNLGIVGEYTNQIKLLMRHPITDIFEEPIIVEKMEPDGYLLLNGHHRWFAALRMNVEKVHIRIVNVVNAKDIGRMMKNTQNTKLVSFDFDEVLLAAAGMKEAPLTSGLFENKYKQRLRIGAPEVIRAFKDKGYDTCIYTSEYWDEEEFKDFFSLYGLEIDIIVNGVNDKRNNVSGNAEHIKEMLRDKYKLIAHVDNEAVVYTNHETKDFAIIDLENTEEWAKSVINVNIEAGQ